MYIVPDKIKADLWVVTCVFNAPRYKSRYKHYHRFSKHIKESGAHLVTIEAAFGEREHAIDPKLSDIFIPVRTSHEIWIKENLLRLAMNRIPSDADYIAWIDSDVFFNRPNWAGETVHQLQHYQFVQMFSQVQDLDPNYGPIGKMRESFVNNVLTGKFKPEDPHYYGGRGASGLAWAARREALDSVGSLMDHCILGAADWHMSHSLFGKANCSFPKDVSSEYKERIMWWQELCDRYIRQNVGTVSGLLTHMWHGKKSDRKYMSRWKVLTDNDYRPSIDLKADLQGVLQLEDQGDARSIKLRDEIRNYFRERNEDNISTS